MARESWGVSGYELVILKVDPHCSSSVARTISVSISATDMF